MKYLKKYKIPFSGLAAGKHNFEFEIDNKFFDCFEFSLLKKGKLLADVSLQKQENMLVVNFNISGNMELSCDTCLSIFDAPVSIQERLIVKFAQEEWDNETEEVVILNKTDQELDISTLLYEFINVQVPYYARCNEQGKEIDCDPSMLAHLAKKAEVSATKESTDPRWEALKNIKNN